MNVNQLNTTTLKRVLALTKRKERWQARIAQIEQQLAALFDHEPTVAAAKPSRRRAVRRAKPGRRTETITALLRRAGPKGITLQAICSTLGLSQNSLNSWMHATGKRIKAIKKLGPGHYGWIG